MDTPNHLQIFCINLSICYNFFCCAVIRSVFQAAIKSEIKNKSSQITHKNYVNTKVCVISIWCGDFFILFFVIVQTENPMLMLDVGSFVIFIAIFIVLAIYMAFCFADKPLSDLMSCLLGFVL